MAEEPRVRRRVNEPAPDTSGRTGCIAVGAVFGIIAGALFTFFALPPILHHFFGEANIAAGATYEGDAKVIRVTDLSIGSPPPGTEVSAPRVAFVSLTVRTNKTWSPVPSDFRLELSNGDRVKANNPARGVTDSALDFDLGVERTLTLMFDLPGKFEVVPRYLHIGDPPVRFELPAPSPSSSSAGGAMPTVEADGRALRLESWSDYLAGPDGRTRIVSVGVRVTSVTDWQPPMNNFVIEFEDGWQLTPVAPIEKMPVMWPQFRAGEPRPFNLLFECPPEEKSQPKALHIISPRGDMPLARSSRQ